MSLSDGLCGGCGVEANKGYRIPLTDKDGVPWIRVALCLIS